MFQSLLMLTQMNCLFITISLHTICSPDADELLKLRKEFQAGAMTKFANFFEGLIQQNGGVGFASTPSIADLTLWGNVKSIRAGDWTGIDANFFDSYKGITATVDSIAKNEKVVAYYASKK